jgi:endo-1,4-beta-D-glucanase Y
MKTNQWQAWSDFEGNFWMQGGAVIDVGASPTAYFVLEGNALAVTMPY